MAKLRFHDYAHEVQEEQVEYLTDDCGWDKKDAEQYSRSHNPLYEVEFEFEYDTETNELVVLSATVEGTRLIPDDSA